MLNKRFLYFTLYSLNISFRCCGWAEDDHVQFLFILSQYNQAVPNNRALCMDMLQRVLPDKTRHELVSLLFLLHAFIFFPQVSPGSQVGHTYTVFAIDVHTHPSKKKSPSGSPVYLSVSPLFPRSMWLSTLNRASAQISSDKDPLGTPQDVLCRPLWATSSRCFLPSP